MTGIEIIKRLHIKSFELSIIPWVLWLLVVWLDFYVILILAYFYFATLDIILWRYLAVQEKRFSSQEFMRWWFKRWVWTLFVWGMTVVTQALAININHKIWRIIIALIPVLPRCALILWELDSLIENLNTIDPNNWFAKMLKKIVSFLILKLDEIVDKKTKISKFVNEVWEGIDHVYYNAFIIKEPYKWKR